MPYLGRPVTNAGQFETIDDISSDFNGSTKSFTLQVGGTNIQPDASNVTITLDGIVQIPSTAYTITGSTINFSEAPPSSTGFHGVLAGQSQFIESDFITNTHIKSSANISGSKINTDFSGKTIKAGVFEGMISGSAQISADISGSFTSTSSSFSTRTTNLESDSGSFSTRVTTIEGSGTAQGVGTSNSPTFAGATINGTLTANEIHTTFVSSSVATITGSNVFGDAVGDLHSFTGSVSISGSQTSLVTAGNVDFNGDLDVDGTTNLDVVDIDGAVDMASTLTIGGDLTIPQKIVHSGDTDNYLSFGTDSLSIYQGGAEKINFQYGNIYIKTNNQSLVGYTTGGGAKELIKLNDSDLVQIGEASGGDVAITEKLTVGSWDNSNTHGHANLNISSDANEGADSYLNFAAGTTIKGYISYDHHATATSQAMKFYVGDAAVNALTIAGGGDATFAGAVQVSDNNLSAKMTTAGAGIRVIADRVDTSDYAGFEAQTGGSQRWFIGVREDSTDNLHFYNGNSSGTVQNVLTLNHSDSSATFTGQVRAINGSASAPSYAFSNDTNGGFYRASDNNFAISSNGSQAFKVSGTGVVLGTGDIVNAQIEMRYTNDGGGVNLALTNQAGGVSSSTNETTGIRFYHGQGGTSAAGAYIVEMGRVTVGRESTNENDSATDGFMAFHTTDGNSMGERMRILSNGAEIHHNSTRAIFTKGKTVGSGANVITFTVTVNNVSSWEPINWLVQANYTTANLSAQGYYYGFGHTNHYSASGLAATSIGHGGGSSNITVTCGNHSSNSFDITVTSATTSGTINMVATLDIRARHGITNIVAS